MDGTKKVNSFQIDINDLLYIRHYSKECRDIRSRLFALKSGCAGY